MPKGNVKWFDAKKGYGFIVGEDGSDIFVHFSAIISDKSFKTLDEGAEVDYEIMSDDKGDRAVNVKLV